MKGLVFGFCLGVTSTVTAIIVLAALENAEQQRRLRWENTVVPPNWQKVGANERWWPTVKQRRDRLFDS